MINLIIRIIEKIINSTIKIVRIIFSWKRRGVVNHCIVENLITAKERDLRASIDTLNENEGLGKSVKELAKIKEEKLRTMPIKEKYF